MKETLRRLSLVMIATALVFTGCKKDQENNNNGDGGNGATTNVINGHEYVDLGLSSGTKWATCNVGATTPEEYGDYYAWGEITTKSEYTRENSRTYGFKMNDISGNSSYDVACVNWGGAWRMPTEQEMDELEDDCAWFWTTQNGIDGMKVYGPNGNSIFLPAGGFCDGSSRGVGEVCRYWSSTPYSSTNTTDAYCFSSKEYRYRGCTVRPVVDIYIND